MMDASKKIGSMGELGFLSYSRLEAYISNIERAFDALVMRLNLMLNNTSFKNLLKLIGKTL